MNIERFVLFLEEYNCCEVKDHFYFVNEYGEEEHYFVLEDGNEVIVRESHRR